MTFMIEIILYLILNYTFYRKNLAPKTVSQDRWEGGGCIMLQLTTEHIKNSPAGMQFSGQIFITNV